MSDFSVEVDGLDEVINKLTRFSSKLDGIAAEVIYKWAQGTRAILKSTPYPNANRKKKTWVSEKQRRFVMAAIRDGRINVPYRRTGGLANRWSAARTTTGAVIRNSAKYAGYVVGDGFGSGQNAEFHAGRWWKGSDVIEKEVPKLTKAISKRIVQEWRK